MQAVERTVGVHPDGLLFLFGDFEGVGVHFGGNGGVGGLHDEAIFGACTCTAAALNALEAIDNPEAFGFIHFDGITGAGFLANATEDAFLHINGDMTL